MIFADKLIRLRKKSGWSQEELAEQMHVSRQAVSKWEGAQSVPDVEKIIMLSQLFGVTTDYLLKDEIEDEPETAQADDTPAVRRVSMEEASAFLAVKEATARPIALGVLMCIMSPVCMFILGALSEMPGSGISENAAGGAGTIVMLVIVAAAVALFIHSGSRTAPFQYLEKEIFETEYGVSGMVRERRERFRGTYTRSNIAGAGLCILSMVPLFGGVIVDDTNDLLMALSLSCMFACVGAGVVFFVRAGIIWESFDKLLQEGDWSRRKKLHSTFTLTVATVYWCCAAAIYLACGMFTGEWERSCVVWVVAAVLYPAVAAVCSALYKRGEE